MSNDLSVDALKDRVDDGVGTDSTVDEAVQNAAVTNIRPESVIYFEEVVDIGFAGDKNKTQNIKGSEGLPGNIAITLREPSLEGGDLYRSTDPSQSAEYKAVGDHNVEPDYDSNGDVNGIKYGIGGGTTFNAELVDDFDEEYITVYVGGTLGIRLGRVLDTYGSPSSMEGGLVEYGSDDGEYATAIRSEPVLRNDMEGHSGAIMAHLPDSDNSNPPFFGTVFQNGERSDATRSSSDGSDGGDDYTPLSPIADTDHEGYDGDAVRSRYTAEPRWSTGSNGTGGASPSSNGGSVMDLSLPTGEAGAVPSYSDFDAEWQMFIDSVSSEGLESFDADLGSIAAEFADENDLGMDVDIEGMRTVVEDRS
jgi:hypothetical protein